MKYYKDKDGNVYAYETQAERDQFGAPDLVEMTAGEVDVHTNPQPTSEQLADTARAERDRLIESVRWRIERHSDELALGSEPTEPLEPLLRYTQALRNVPQQEGFPETISWPVLPGGI